MTSILNPIHDSDERKPPARDSNFLEEVLRQFLVRMQRDEANNYDATRFSYDGVDRSGGFNLEYHKQNLCFFIANWEKFQAALSLFEEQASRALFLDLILFRLAGHLHVKLPRNTPRYWELRDQAFALPSQPSLFNFQSRFGPLKHFGDLPFGGQKLSLDCWPDDIASTFFIRQYHFDRGNVRIAPAAHNHVVDAGACFGDTTVAFATAVGAEGRVYAFDPLQTHAEVIQNNIALNGLQKTITFFPVGLGAQGNMLAGPVPEEEMVNPGFNFRQNSGGALPLRSMDELVTKGDIERVDFLKMDIEGSELAALQGAKETIRKYKPRLAISIYHHFGDFFEIPLYLQELKLGYKFYLDHYTLHAEESVLYAVVGGETG